MKEMKSHARLEEHKMVGLKENMTNWPFWPSLSKIKKYKNYDHYFIIVTIYNMTNSLI